MAELTGNARPIDLGNGYAIRAPGVRGRAELLYPRTASERSRSRSSNDGTTALDDALTACGVVETRQIELTVRSTATAGDSATLRSADQADDVIELAVPDLGPQNGQLVLSCDEFGVLTWHLPVDGDGTAASGDDAASSRGSGAVKRFRIPAAPVDAVPESDGTNRSLIGVIGRRLLKVLVYPLTDPLLGALSASFAHRWEASHRAYGLRDFTPLNFRDAGAHALTESDWTRLSAGRALLFVHGTFSTAHSAFAGLPDATFAELYQRYDGRVFAFNHPSLSEGPDFNAAWFREQTAGRSLDIDIICHSRGGLVARAIASGATVGTADTRAAGAADVVAPTDNVRVHNIVFVGVPNAGTPLAAPEHVVSMIDRFTTALNLFPTGIVTETLEAIITAVKVIGHGALQGLDGLASMQPRGAFLSQLNGAASGRSSSTNYFAISANYEPVGAGLRAMLRGSTANAVLDRIFEQVENDLVVPEPGVYGVEGCAAFPIREPALLRVPGSAGVIHTTLFGYPPTSERLLQWLPGA